MTPWCVACFSKIAVAVPFMLATASRCQPSIASPRFSAFDWEPSVTDTPLSLIDVTEGGLARASRSPAKNKLYSFGMRPGLYLLFGNAGFTAPEAEAVTANPAAELCRRKLRRFSFKLTDCIAVLLFATRLRRLATRVPSCGAAPCVSMPRHKAALASAFFGNRPTSHWTAAAPCAAGIIRIGGMLSCNHGMSLTVESQCVTFPSLELDCGVRLLNVDVAYETYGTLNPERTNAILIHHAFSGDAHAAGMSTDGQPGWWSNMIGPGLGFDTDRYFVICTNVLGGCRGTTGPGSIDPSTGTPFGMRFPVITIGDMVRLQKCLIDHLGIKKLLAVSGGSMGGMQALEWAVAYPQCVAAAIPIATTARHSAQQIAFNEVGRQAIMADPDWNEGNYYDGKPPARGLAVARMVGHITYMSDASMRQKFGRRLRDKDAFGYDFSVDFEVESYLRYRGNQFVSRFDANSYLYITKAMDYFDLSGGKPSLAAAFDSTTARFLVLSFTSDWLYPTYQSLEIVSALRGRNIDVAFCELPSSYGHDAFLVEVKEQTEMVQGFLDSVYRDVHR